VTGYISSDHTHSGTTGGENVGHTHSYTVFKGSDPNGPLTGASTGGEGTGASTSDRSAAHVHAFSTGGVSANHYHAITSEGGGGAHETVHPVAVVNSYITTR
jgi:hypothetical protein